MKLLNIILFFAALGCLQASVCTAEPISVDAISVTDGDTIAVGGTTYRMVGYDTPEITTHRRKVGPDEKALATLAKERFSELLHSGPLDLTEVDCSCPKTTIGTKDCNYGRKCAILSLNGKNIGDTLIAEELARPFHCGATKCEKLPDWPRIIEQQLPHGQKQ
jgi:endonuclease YncB( thermonuclease family)